MYYKQHFDWKHSGIAHRQIQRISNNVSSKFCVYVRRRQKGGACCLYVLRERGFMTLPSPNVKMSHTVQL